MLVKLLKYDLKYMIKNMSIFYILSLFFALTTKILLNVERSVIVDIIGQISIGSLFSMLANTLINTIMRSWLRFRDSIYKDEAYLTHTLPITKNELYNSKIIQTLIFFVISFIVILASLAIAYYSRENWRLLTEFIKTFTSGLNMSILFFVGMALILIFLEIFNAIQCGFFGMILGYKRNKGKLAFSISFGFLAYLLTQSAVLFLVFIYGLFDASIMDLFKTAPINIDAHAFKTLALISSLLYLIIIYGMSILCKRFLKRGVDIE